MHTHVHHSPVHTYPHTNHTHIYTHKVHIRRVCTYTPIHTHTLTHKPHIHTHILAQCTYHTHVHMPTYVHMHIHTHYTYTHACIHTSIHTAHMPPHTNHTYLCVHATHTYTLTHIRTYMYSQTLAHIHSGTRWLQCTGPLPGASLPPWGAHPQTTRPGHRQDPCATSHRLGRSLCSGQSQICRRRNQQVRPGLLCQARPPPPHTSRGAQPHRFPPTCQQHTPRVALRGGPPLQKHVCTPSTIDTPFSVRPVLGPEPAQASGPLCGASTLLPAVGTPHPSSTRPLLSDQSGGGQVTVPFQVVIVALTRVPSKDTGPPPAPTVLAERPAPSAEAPENRGHGHVLGHGLAPSPPGPCVKKPWAVFRPVVRAPGGGEGDNLFLVNHHQNFSAGC